MGRHDESGQECHDSSIESRAAAAVQKPWIASLSAFAFSAIDGPVTKFREKVVLPLQSKNTEKFYHRRFKRVPTADQCDFQDPVCLYEANEQFYRDKMVDSSIVRILRQRQTDCYLWEGPGAELKCKPLVDEYETAATHWFMKYGEMRTSEGALEAYMKQKHRLIWERRNPEKKLH